MAFKRKIELSKDMIDLHSHLLPGIDDGAIDSSMSLEMARAFIDDGVNIVACTPHILPGIYHNTGPQIKEAVNQLQVLLDQNHIPLKLVSGADNHVVHDFVSGLSTGHLLSLADTRYVLVEPPHHVMPARLGELLFSIQVAGYVPILTHPERLTWIRNHYDTVVNLAKAGVWMQITAGSLTGSFGRTPKYWSERMLSDGLVHIIATDAHNMKHRPPMLGRGRQTAAKLIGEEEAYHMVVTRPQGILNNLSPDELPMPEIKVANSKGSEHEDFSPDNDFISSHNRNGISKWVRRKFGRTHNKYSRTDSQRRQ